MVRPQWYRGVRYWCVKDPLARSYFHLRDEEFAVLGLLDGRTGAAAVCREFGRRFPHLTLTADRLAAFAAGLAANGLVTVPRAAAGAAALERGRKAAVKERVRAARGVLAVRFRGFDPTWLLGWLHSLFGWLFAPPAVLAMLALTLGAAGLVAVRFEQFAAALPAMGEFLSLANLPWLLAVLGAMKVVHELAHAVACARFGGECRELGVMFLVFAPCLYCDVSDTWLLADRRKRVAVAAAGIAAELVLAAAAVWLWTFAEPGVVKTLLLNAAVVGSVGTVLFNGNPLLRYDGYFILSDLLEIPNLAQRATEAWHGLFRRWFFSPRPGDLPAPVAPGSDARERAWLLGYGVAALVYRVFLMAAIVWLVFLLLTPLGLRAAAEAIAVLTLFGMAAGPATATWKAVRGSGSALFSPAGWWSGARPARGAGADDPAAHRPPLRPGRTLLAVLAAGGLVAAVGLVPVPEYVEAPAVLRAEDAARVFATVGGRLVEAVPPGTAVRAGETVAVLDDPDLDREVADLRGRLELAELRRDVLEARRLVEPELAGEREAAARRIETLAAQLARRERDRAELRLPAPAAGRVLPPPRTTVPPTAAASDDAPLPAWSGTPLDAENRGAWVEPGTLVALVAPGGKEFAGARFFSDEKESADDPFAADAHVAKTVAAPPRGRVVVSGPGPAEVRLVVSEADVQRVAAGQPVRVRLDQRPDRVFVGTVDSVAGEVLAVAPRELAGTAVAVRTDLPGAARPAVTSYEVRVRLTDPDAGLRLRGTGVARVRVTSRPLATRLYRGLRRVFRFEL